MNQIGPQSPNSQRTTFFVAVHVFLIKDDLVLLTRRFQTGYEDGNYSVPAGHLEAGESPTQAALREVKEETGIAINPKDLQFVHVMHRMAHRQSVDFFFACHTWSGEPKITEPDKCDEVLWCDMQKLPQNTIPYIKLAIGAFLSKKVFLEVKD